MGREWERTDSAEASDRQGTGTLKVIRGWQSMTRWWERECGDRIHKGCLIQRLRVCVCVCVRGVSEQLQRENKSVYLHYNTLCVSIKSEWFWTVIVLCVREQNVHGYLPERSAMRSSLDWCIKWIWSEELAEIVMNVCCTSLNLHSQASTRVCMYTCR